jgi:hypothetical protein
MPVEILKRGIVTGDVDGRSGLWARSSRAVRLPRVNSTAMGGDGQNKTVHVFDR